MSNSTFKRREKKLLFPVSILDSLKADILTLMNYDSHNVNGEPYLVCNLYFDTPDDDVIRDSIQKPKYKEKLRLRSYGVPDDTTPVFLEIKRKLDGIGTKRRVILPLKEMNQYLQTRVRPQQISELDNQILNEIDYYLNRTGVSPRTYLSYLRIAFSGKENPDFRVTLDYHILSRRYDLDLKKGSYGETQLPEGYMLMEVKFKGAVPLPFQAIMSKYNLSFGNYSKIGTSFKLHNLQQIIQEQKPNRDIKTIKEDIAFYGRIL